MSTPDSWHPYLTQTPLTDSIRQHYAAEEAACLNILLPDATPNAATQEKVRALTIDLLGAARKPYERTFSVESFLQEYGLDTHEGLMLMCLAEALLRIPDNETAQLFIEDKLTHDNWEKHLGHSHSFWVNASTWGLVVASNLFKDAPQPEENRTLFKRVMQKLGEPIAVSAIKRAMQIMGGQFVAGTSIEDALRNNAAEVARGYWHSYDMLGEAAINDEEARHYLDAYAHAIETIASTHRDNILQASISIKLSALHARFEPRKLAARELIIERVAKLIELAREREVMVTIDAEESWRLEPTLEIFSRVIGRLKAEYQAGIGLAVQAYQKRAPYVIQWLNELAHKHNTRIPVRLVKGAYWDAEIKYAQQMGHENYPVYTRKVNTDIAYLACARRLMKAEFLDPQFATHNAHTVASLLQLRDEFPDKAFEFQRLHGMGESLYNFVLDHNPATRCRVYAPVGSYRDLLAYLVRRLLENGANTSFVRLVQTVDSTTTLAQEPVVIFNALGQASHPRIPPPPKLYPDRANSRGLNLEAERELTLLLKNLDAFFSREYHAVPISSAVMQPESNPNTLYAPANNTTPLGKVTNATAGDVVHALNQAQEFFPHWSAMPVNERAQCLQKMADLLEQHRYELIALLVREGGKTLQNAIAEIREAADFCRYYAVQAVKLFNQI
ncbi:MAG TPA: bifunctional proline dehydrogenase/L-glutamate gamma-semialdehyde dehydrogenase PutA, partial [Pseudomonadales bacterium]|nr:bifunctional proline dehydrogenase/L-glutamate gamma-semialdehyde dehydrogenase PutA [Pseudomonadales bacterium]